jgi:PAS domain S-box-containing protein/putative nucleotidyltransferase with HDIG domain
MYLLDLVHNIALVVALSAIFPLVARRWGLRTLPGRFVSGLLFGIVILVGMVTPARLGSGLIFDGRSIVLCAAGVLGGPVVAGLAALIAVAYRIALGGGGDFVGIAVIVESAAFGVAFYYARLRNPQLVTPLRLFGLGLAVHLVMLALMFGLPGGMGAAVVRQIGAVVLTVSPLATAAVCWFLLQGEERIEAREELKRSEERFKLAIEASDSGLWDWDVKSGEVTVSDRIAGMLGYPAEELATVTYDTWMGLVHPDDLAEAESQIARHLAGVTPFYHDELRMRHQSGRWVWVATRGKVTKRDGSGHPLRMTGTHVDITEYRAVEDALHDSNAKLGRMVLDVAATMGKVVEARDPYTQGHQQRVSVLARNIAEDMGLSEDETDEVGMAGLLHDIGKLNVPTEILTKPGALSAAEFALIREHPTQGFEILKDIAFPWPIAEIVLQHHERMDGSGYPRGITGDEILVPARILAVADVVEAMASHRPYRPSLGLPAAITEITSTVGAYDPAVVAACVHLFEEGRLGL